MVRPAAVGVGTLSPPALGVFHPALGAAIVIVEITAFLIVVFTAIYGPAIMSERAFRALRLVTNSAEPPAPPTGPPT